MRKRLTVIALAAFVCLAQSTAYAWNSTGHRSVAFIAYQQLKQNDPDTLEKVLTVLRSHPAAGTDLWTNGGINGADPDLNLFLNAATFPDDVRFPPNNTRFDDSKFKKYHHRDDHFVNLRFEPAVNNSIGGSKGGTLLSSYVARVKAVKNNAPGPLKNFDQTPEPVAVSLSWIFHQIGDVHQPLHATLRISETFPAPEGDEGGNSVKKFPNRRGDHEMHAFWDDLLGGDHQAATPEKIAAIAQKARDAFPPDSFDPDDLKGADDLTEWAEESFQLAVQKAYVPLGAALDGGEAIQLPDGYEADAIKTANQRVAQAGYRLAAELKSIFAAR